MNGVYGTIKPSNITPNNDVEIFYYYRPTRSESSADFTSFQPLDSKYLTTETAETEDGNTIKLFGLYTLQLPLDKFNKKGFYSVYIRPKEIKATIKDVSVLAAYPSVRGIVLDATELGGTTDLTGYVVEYYDTSNTEDKLDRVRLITSSNYCTPVIASTGDSYPKSVRYALNDASSNYLFCTMTPSSASSFRTNAAPYIGTTGEIVCISNTKFSPVLLEIEMVDHDEDTISWMLEGDTVRDRDNSIITTYNDDHEIYHQADYYTIKTSLGTPLYDVKKEREDIDGTQSYDNIINGEG